MSTRTLLSIAIFVLIAIGIELFYLTIFKSTTGASLTSKGNSLPRKSGTVTVDPKIVNYLENFNSNVLTSSVVTVNYQGVVFKILKTPNVAGTVKYEEGLQIRATNNLGNPNYLLIRDVDLPKLNVYDPDGSQIDFTDLKEGDKIKVTEKIDMLKDDLNNKLSIDIMKQD